MKEVKILIIFGTRPELIKLAHLIHQFQKFLNKKLRICFPDQHPDMVDSLLKFFNIQPNITLNIQRASSSLGILILTDSSGLQEEALSLGKPVLVLRENTERIEGVEEGISFLIGTNKGNIIKNTLKFLNNRSLYEKVAKKKNS